MLQLTMPAEWGNPRAVIKGHEGTFDAETLHDVLWKGLTHYASSYNAGYINDFGHCEDISNGFDMNTIRFRVVIDDNFELLRTTTEHLKRLMHLAYMDIPYRLRKKAKQ